MLSFAVMGNKFLSYLFIIFQKQEELRKWLRLALSRCQLIAVNKAKVYSSRVEISHNLSVIRKLNP